MLCDLSGAGRLTLHCLCSDVEIRWGASATSLVIRVRILKSSNLETNKRGTVTFELIAAVSAGGNSATFWMMASSGLLARSSHMKTIIK